MKSEQYGVRSRVVGKKFSLAASIFTSCGVPETVMVHTWMFHQTSTWNKLKMWGSEKSKWTIQMNAIQKALHAFVRTVDALIVVCTV
jgi:hypothetical protein